MAKKGKTVRFKAPILQPPEYPTASYVEFPWDIKETFGKGRVKVKVWFDDVFYRGSLVKMNGVAMLLMRKDVKAKVNKDYGDIVAVTVEEDLEERKVEVPALLKKAFKSEPKAKSFFQKLSYTHQKEYATWIKEAKREETKNRRVEKTIQLLLDGKKTK